MSSAPPPRFPADDSVARNRADRDAWQGWQPIGGGHRLRRPPTGTAGPLLHTSPTLLNTEELRWEDFERLIVAIALAEGANDARLYGRRRQKQDGIDVVAWFPARTAYTAYQAKAVRRFTASGLQTIVDEYRAGRRFPDTDRFVVAVASEVRDTEVQRRLARLRKELEPVELELWDRQRLSETLRRHPALIERFFGPATRALFVGAAEWAGSVPAEEASEAATGRRRPAAARRRRIAMTIAVLLAIVGAAALLVPWVRNSAGVDGGLCHRFEVTTFGNIIGEDDKKAGEVHAGDIFLRVRTEFPRRLRSYGHVEGEDVYGYVLNHKLRAAC